jgi:ATP-dependent Clp protease ATP-binding subunit ClpB
MQPTLCARCQKNVAVIFITKIENGTSKNEGLCLKCARELHIKPVDDMISKLGLSDEELENLTGEMMEALGSADGLMDIENSEEDGDEDGKTATFPFLNRLFGAQNNQNNQNPPERQPDNLPPRGSAPAPGGEAPKQSNRENSNRNKRKFLDN